MEVRGQGRRRGTGAIAAVAAGTEAMRRCSVGASLCRPTARPVTRQNPDRDAGRSRGYSA